jgi:hypothetical protein
LNDDRCPVCGEGTLVDIAFDSDDRLGGKPAQTAGSREISSYSCGHTAKGARLDGADQEELAVERRTSSDVTDTEAP